MGKSLGIDPQLLGRHPFPGPGLAIRILGDITPEKVEILQNVDKSISMPCASGDFTTRYGRRERFCCP